MCPSPRCSRRVAASCQSRPTGSPGRASAALAANRGLPVGSAAAATGPSSRAARSHACGSTPTSRSAAVLTAARASMQAAGVVRDHASGSALATMAGWNPAKTAMTGGAGTGPSGAARNAK